MTPFNNFLVLFFFLFLIIFEDFFLFVRESMHKPGEPQAVGEAGSLPRKKPDAERGELKAAA